MPDTSLPIWDSHARIIDAIRSGRRLLLTAPTGSGKTTQVPQMLLKSGLLDSGQAVILQPRRLAARLLAARVASELDVPLGQDVGYQIRFENVSSAKTKIRFVTEGVLLRQMIDDPSLEGVSTLIFDEFHERHLYGDITLARALDLQEQRRPDLRIAVMSATLDADLLAPYMARTSPLTPDTPHLAPDTPHLTPDTPHLTPVTPHPAPVTSHLAPATPHSAPVTSHPAPVTSHPAPVTSHPAPATPHLAPHCTVLSSEGRTFPVEITYAAEPSYADKRPVWDQAADAFSRYMRSGGKGDVLVFMPGGFEIAQTIEAIRNTDESKGFILLPLHGELSPRDQDAAVARYAQRKVVVSTNVAETSLTIDGVRLVIDSGLARIARHDPYRGINTLLVEKISQSSAEQRAGRGGRTAPGACIRLWSRDEHQHRPAQQLPEVKRLDLAEVVLTLKAAGIENLRKFRWLEPPDEQSLVHAEELLTDLGALKRPAPPQTPAGLDAPRPSTNPITSLGRRMLAFPIHPRYARMLLAAQEYGCVYQTALVAALTQGRDLLIRNPGRDVNALREDLLGEKASSDFWILMRAWTYAANNQFKLDACRRLGIHALTARQVGPLFDHFLRIAQREGLDIKPREIKDEALQKCVLIGFSDRVAHRLDQGTLRCELVHGRRGVLARDSAVHHSPLFVTAEIREVEGRDNELNTILSLATAIDPAWLAELFPEDIETELRVEFDSTSRRVQAAELLRFRGLALSAKRVEPPPADAAARLLADEVLAGRLVLKQWDHATEQWILRLNLLAEWCPELELPPISDDDRRHIIEQLCHGAFGYKDIKDRDAKPAVRSWLSQPQQELLDKHAPERLILSNSRTPRITYDQSNPPYISMRIQELYGVSQTPKIALGRVPVLLHILTPGMKPVQVTQDLAGFWRDHYPRIKSELQRKYPKHEWK